MKRRVVREGGGSPGAIEARKGFRGSRGKEVKLQGGNRHSGLEVGNVGINEVV